MTARVFVCYRREDSSHVVGRLTDRLADAFGSENVFYDVDSIEPGADFRQVVLATLTAIDVVLVAIGPGWAAERLRAANDYVRMEIAEAFRQTKRVIPVLIDGAQMPSPSDLPAELGALPFLHATRLRRDPDFRSDAQKLLNFLQSLPGTGAIGSPSGSAVTLAASRSMVCPKCSRTVRVAGNGRYAVCECGQLLENT